MWLLQLDDVWQLSISSAYLGTLLIQFCWYLLCKCLRKTAPQAGTVLVWEPEPRRPPSASTPCVRDVYSCVVLYSALAWIPSFLYLNRMYYPQDPRHKPSGGVFCRPDIVGNLHFGFTGWSWLGKTYFPGMFFQHFSWPHYIFWKMLEKPGKQNT